MSRERPQLKKKTLMRKLEKKSRNLFKPSLLGKRTKVFLEMPKERSSSVSIAFVNVPEMLDVVANVPSILTGNARTSLSKQIREKMKKMTKIKIKKQIQPRNLI